MQCASSRAALDRLSVCLVVKRSRLLVHRAESKVTMRLYRAQSMMTLRLQDWGHTASQSPYSQPYAQTICCSLLSTPCEHSNQSPALYTDCLRLLCQSLTLSLYCAVEAEKKALAQKSQAVCVAGPGIDWNVHRELRALACCNQPDSNPLLLAGLAQIWLVA